MGVGSDGNFIEAKAVGYSWIYIYIRIYSEGPEGQQKNMSRVSSLTPIFECPPTF